MLVSASQEAQGILKPSTWGVQDSWREQRCWAPSKKPPLLEFSFKFQLRQIWEDRGLLTYSEELITLDNEPITNKWDRKGSVPLLDCCGSHPSASVLTLQHCRQVRPGPLLKLSQALGQVLRKGVGDTGTLAPPIQPRLPSWLVTIHTGSQAWKKHTLLSPFLTSS